MVSSMEEIGHSERGQKNNGSQCSWIAVLIKGLMKSQLIEEVTFGQRLRSSGGFNDVLIWRKCIPGKETTSAKVQWRGNAWWVSSIAEAQRGQREMSDGRW